jgi:hypothetical protein
VSEKGTTARGYGTVHQRERARWRPVVEAGGVVCRRCKLPIVPGTLWHLGHDDHDRTLPAAPEHARCNLVSAARRGGRAVAAKRRVVAATRPPSDTEVVNGLRYQMIDGERVLLPPGIGRWSRKWADVDPSEYEQARRRGR